MMQCRMCLQGKWRFWAFCDRIEVMGKITKKIKSKLPGAAEREARKTEKEKLEERREEVLSRGKKFKYPMQFAKHTVILATVVISVLALAGAGVLGWAMLYKRQDTGDVIYRLTKILPVSVAKIDGEKVKYSDYLMIYRTSMTPVIEQNATGSTDDIEGMQNYYKRQALTEAENYTYAMKIAREQDVTVSEEEIDTMFAQHLKAGGTERSKESFLKVLQDNFGMSEKEYRRLLYFSILTAKVDEKLDDNARKIANEVAQKLSENGGDLQKIAEEYPDLAYEETGGLISTMNVDGGRAVKAYAQEVGQVSGRLLSSNGDGYYFVKTVEKGDQGVSYQSIKIEFTELDKRLLNLREEGLVEEYIELEETSN